VDAKPLQPDSAKLAELGLRMEDVEAPVPIKKTTPAYPETARQALVQGIVELKCVIRKTGDVGSCSVIKSLSPECDGEAIRAVSQWQYTPTKVKGKPVAVYLNISVQFHLGAP
jgi:TonB family protein